ncbi:c-type cytochrome [Candidatus Riflebacteria bacterium]
MTPVIRGEALSHKLGCFACHLINKKGLKNYGTKTGNIPPWDKGTAKMYISTEDDIRNWILYGSWGKRPFDPKETFGWEKPLIPMPAYKNEISRQDLEDLVAYFKAVNWWDPKISEIAYGGLYVSHKMGCLGCHGPSGLGGITNPGSKNNQIPPWNGKRFGELARNEDEIKEWILEGIIERLKKDPDDMKYRRKHKTRMPAYKKYIDNTQLKKIVAYILYVREGKCGEDLNYTD